MPCGQYNPWITRDLCRRFPTLKLTADLSHFCVVAERVFRDDDEDWIDVMSVVADHTRHIHARVGYAQVGEVCVAVCVAVCVRVCVSVSLRPQPHTRPPMPRLTPDPNTATPRAPTCALRAPPPTNPLQPPHVSPPRTPRARTNTQPPTRAGCGQGPQVPDPRAPEYEAALVSHEKWWDQIIATQAAKGVGLMTVEPEHGTDGYQHKLPYT